MRPQEAERGPADGPQVSAEGRRASTETWERKGNVDIFVRTAEREPVETCPQAALQTRLGSRSWLLSVLRVSGQAAWPLDPATPRPVLWPEVS